MSTLPDLPVAPAAVAAAPRLRLVPPVSPAFDEAVRAVTPRLTRYVVRRLGDRHEAEELVQEALLRAYQHADQLRTEDDLAAWTTVVAGRLVIDRLRVRGRSTSVAEVPEGVRTARDTAEVVVARDEARTALDALDAMPPRQAAVLWAREVEGLGYDAIGERYGMTEPAVRSLLTRARKALRREFSVRGGTLPAGGLVALAPWVDGLTWVERLRRAATRTVTPAVVAVLGAGVLGGALVTPWTLDTPLEERPAVLRSGVVAPAPAAPQDLPGAGLPAAVAPAARPADRPTAPPAAPPAGPTAVRGVLDRLDDTCVGTRSAGVGGRCAPGGGGDELVLAPLVTLPEPVDLPGDGGLGTELPAPVCRTLHAALPRTALPSTALPRTALPRTALPRTALPTTALPGPTTTQPHVRCTPEETP